MNEINNDMEKEKMGQANYYFIIRVLFHLPALPELFSDTLAILFTAVFLVVDSGIGNKMTSAGCRLAHRK